MENAFVTFLLFHGFVCIRVPAIDCCGIRRLRSRDTAKKLGLVQSSEATRIGVGTGVLFLLIILVFFFLLRDSVIDPDEIQMLLRSWHIKKHHVLVLLFIMILANSVLEEVYWRGYIFERLRARAGPASTIILSSLFCGSYHFITTANLFSVQIGILFTCVVLLAGVFW